MDAVEPVAGRHILDGTFGAGGYSRAFLMAGARVTAIDRDPSVAVFADRLKKTFPDRFRFVPGRFADLAELSGDADAVVLDLGMSSMQIDDAERGFSFMRAGPLDMRMEQQGRTAADIVNRSDEREISDILFELGEERHARRIARAIVARRVERPIEQTSDLAELVCHQVGKRHGGSHPATRTFQALRIAVNAEYQQLVRALFAIEALLACDGVLAVVTFHSIEDRMVKRFFKPQEKGSRFSPRQEPADSPWNAISKAVRPSKSECGKNPRARSATLRFAVRNDGAARQFSLAGLGVPGYARRELVE